MRIETNLQCNFFFKEFEGSEFSWQPFFTLVKMKKMFIFIFIFFILLGNEINEVKADFGDTFPGVIGAIDGTLIHIRCPSGNKEAYNCRKRSYALNVLKVQVFANYSRSKCHCFTLLRPQQFKVVYCKLMSGSFIVACIEYLVTQR